MESCLVLAVEANGQKITTIEGIAKEGVLSPIRRKFIEHDALQCGFCTPSFVLTAHYLLLVNPNPTESEIEEYLSGHIRRCGTYKQMIEAILECAKKQNRAKASQRRDPC